MSVPEIDPPAATAFAALKPESVQFLLGRAHSVPLHAGDTFLHEGDPGGDLYVVRTGRVEVFLERNDEGTPEPVRIHLAELGPGDCLGETSLLGVLPRTASVVALTEGSAIRLRNTDLLAFSEKDPREFAILMINLGREVARRLWLMNERLLEQLRRIR